MCSYRLCGVLPQPSFQMLFVSICLFPLPRNSTEEGMTDIIDNEENKKKGIPFSISHRIDTPFNPKIDKV